MNELLFYLHKHTNSYVMCEGRFTLHEILRRISPEEMCDVISRDMCIHKGWIVTAENVYEWNLIMCVSR